MTSRLCCAVALMVSLTLPGLAAAERLRDLSAAQTAELSEAYLNWEQRFADYQSDMARVLGDWHKQSDSAGSAREQARLKVLQTQADLLLDLARDHHRLRTRIRQAIAQLQQVQADYGGRAARLEPVVAGHERLLAISTANATAARELEVSLVRLVLHRLAAGATSGERLAAEAARAEQALNRRKAELVQQREELLAEIARVRASANLG